MVSGLYFFSILIIFDGGKGMNTSLGYLLKLQKFEYFEAKSVREGCLLLSKYGRDAKLIAGGTDLLISMKKREISPKYLINIKNIPELNCIEYGGRGLRIGALTTLNDVENSPVVQDKVPILASSCHQIGTPQIRNLGTIGGNICNASPSADTAPSLIGLGAKVKIVGLNGERTIPVEEFFVGPGESALQESEILTEIQIPNLSEHTKGIYLKLPARTAIDIATVGVAVVLILDSKNHNALDIKIVLGAVGSTPIRAYKAEEIIKGKVIQVQLIKAAAQTAALEAKPISDIRGSANYRKQMVKVLTDRALRQVGAL
jgi:carbon-monoxide dehydrogenase medium subunit